MNPLGTVLWQNNHYVSSYNWYYGLSDALEELDSDSSWSEGNVTTFKCPPGFRELHKWVDKFSGKSSENDFKD